MMSKFVGANLPHGDVWEEFKAFVRSKHGKKHTVLGEELERAIKMYLNHEYEAQEKAREERGSAHTHTQSKETEELSKSIKELSRTMKNVQKVMKEVLKYASKEVPQYEVEEAITRTVGGDPRTIQKYLMMLQEYKLLIPRLKISNRPNIFEINHKALEELNANSRNTPSRKAIGRS